jgi:hypothetical protein
MTRAGSASSGVPCSRVASSTCVTTTGPSAMPRLPPTVNQLMAWVESPAMPRAVRVASGCRSMARNGSRAGTAPWYRSSATWVQVRDASRVRSVLVITGTRRALT